MEHVRRVMILALAVLVLSSGMVALTSVSAEAAISAAKGKKVVKVAASLKGTKYRRGGTSPKGFDCSGFTRYVYKKATGKKLARTSNGQLKYKHISKSKKRKGDLIIFTRRGRAYHAAIYAGANRIWHASKPGTRTSKSKIWTSGYVVRRP